MIKILKLAFPYKEQLQEKINEIIFEEKYMYYNCGTYWDYEIKIDNDSWNKMEFVSIDINNNIIGYFSASINRTSGFVSSLKVVNFYNINLTFSKDFYQFIKDLFRKFDFPKIKFTVVVGNPAEKMYDKYIKKYGGYIVGTYKDDVKLQNGKYYDSKMYEIFKKDFEEAIKCDFCN